MAIKVLSVADFINDEDIYVYILPFLGLDPSDSVSLRNVKNKLNSFMSELRNELSVVIETNYVDKVYRDTFYGYHSSKLKSVGRDCVKISFIDLPKESISFDTDALIKISHKYLGFLILRPLEYAVIGRNTINPSAFVDCGNRLSICKSNIPTTCLGMKTNVFGFPHSSQDAEMMSCAETTIWSVMEYFGNKYPEYTPILPSEIHKILASISYQRQLPSGGLTYNQIATVLKHNGFGTMVYYRDNDQKFKEILTCYLESGIPVVLLLRSDKIGHAVVGVGHKKFDRNALTCYSKESIYGKDYYVWNRSVDEFVINDDNQNPCQLISFDKPTANYNDPDWDKVNIQMFIVPLYKRVYLEAQEALGFSKYLVARMLKARSDSVVRTFLASSRSYREYLMTNSDILPTQKEFYLNIKLPKFVWVTEISDFESCKNNRINGIILLDATNPHVHTIPLIFSQYDGNEYFFNRNNASIEIISLNLPKELESFNHNIN